MATEASFEPIVVSTLSGLDSPGDTVTREGHIDLGELSLGGHTFTLSGGLDFSVALTNTGEGVLATGIVRGEATAPCDRCLEPADIDIAGEVSCYFLREPRGDEGEDEDDDDSDYGIIAPDGTVDLSEAIQSAVLSDLPFVVLCSEDCKGLCPDCGANLNRETCDCASRRASQVDPMSPFAALAGLDLSGSPERDGRAGDRDGVMDDVNRPR